MRICATRQEMADEINASVKTVIRGLQQLAKCGLICLDGRGITIRTEDYEGMRAILEKELLSYPIENRNLDF